MRVVDIITQKLKEHSLRDNQRMDRNTFTEMEMGKSVEEKQVPCPIDSGTESDGEDAENSDPESGEVQAILQDNGDDVAGGSLHLQTGGAFKRPLRQSNGSSFIPVRRSQQSVSHTFASPVGRLSSSSSEEELSCLVPSGRSSTQQREKRKWEQANVCSSLQEDMKEPVMFSSSPPKGVYKFTRTLSPRVFLEQVAPTNCTAGSFASPAKRYRQSVMDDVSTSVPPRPSLDFEKMQAQVHCC